MIYLASDHGGFAVKEQVKKILSTEGIAYKDLGPLKLQSDDDYPDYVLPLAEKVAKEEAMGIVSCRNGQGVAIAANKVYGVRAAVCWNESCAETARTDDNANILSLPADYLSSLEIEKIVAAWIATPFSHDARHLRRLTKVTDYEASNMRGK
jgi:ribose 5-phosphate isomerase B